MDTNTVDTKVIELQKQVQKLEKLEKMINPNSKKSLILWEEDEIHPVSNKKWNVVYFNGDLFILDKQVKEATKYYQDDNNYEWYFIVDEEETEKEFSIPINNEELKYIYDMDNMRKTTSLTFNDIEKMGTLKKVSKDGFISAIICLANYNDSWYYRTEIMNEKDEEYIIVLPETLNKKIDKLLYS